MNLIISNLETNMKNTLFLETETGKLTIADIFTTSQQLFLVIFLNYFKPILILQLKHALHMCVCVL